MRLFVALTLAAASFAGCDAPSGGAPAALSEALSALPRCAGIDMEGQIATLIYADRRRHVVTALEGLGSRIDVYDPVGRLQQTQMTVGGAFLEEVRGPTGQVETMLDRPPRPETMLPLELGDSQTFAVDAIRNGSPVRFEIGVEVTGTAQIWPEPGSCVYDALMVEYRLVSDDGEFLTRSLYVPALRANVADIPDEAMAEGALNVWDLPEQVIVE